MNAPNENSMTAREERGRAGREYAAIFLHWAATQQIALCEHTATAGWQPVTETIDSLIDRCAMIDRKQLAAERLALQHDGDACPCERDPS